MANIRAQITDHNETVSKYEDTIDTSDINIDTELERSSFFAENTPTLIESKKHIKAILTRIPALKTWSNDCLSDLVNNNPNDQNDNAMNIEDVEESEEDGESGDQNSK